MESVASSDESVCSAPSSATAASHSFQVESATVSVQLPVPAVSPKVAASATSSLVSSPVKCLSKSLRGAGFHTVAVDVKDASGHPVVKLDLLAVSGVTLLWEFLKSGQFLYVHMAPPCSTASAARFIPGGPRPLRSAQEPDGLSGLSFSQRVQVSNANRLYCLCKDVALFCQAHGMGWSIENPSGSMFWMCSPMRDLTRHLGDNLCTVVFDHCCWGGDRPKRTALWSNLPCLSALAMLCSPALGHVHKAWGRLPDGTWSTKAEAAYPLPLCRFWSQLLASRWARRALGLLPRGRHPSEVPNPFSECFCIRVPAETQATLLVPGAEACLSGAPKGCKVVGCTREDSGWLVEIGVPCQPDAFMRAASSVRHPAEVDPELPSDLEYVVNCVESLSCGELASLRCQFLHSLLQRAQELSTLERQLHAGLAPHCRSVLKGKRLLLLGELLTGLGHADVHLVADVCSGFRLTGWLRASRVMEPKLTAPTESADNLWRRRVDRLT